VCGQARACFSASDMAFHRPLSSFVERVFGSTPAAAAAALVFALLSAVKAKYAVVGFLILGLSPAGRGEKRG